MVTNSQSIAAYRAALTCTIEYNAFWKFMFKAMTIFKSVLFLFSFKGNDYETKVQKFLNQRKIWTTTYTSTLLCSAVKIVSNFLFYYNFFCIYAVDSLSCWGKSFHAFYSFINIVGSVMLQCSKLNFLQSCPLAT